jgi:hypothetical protein
MTDPEQKKVEKLFKIWVIMSFSWRERGRERDESKVFLQILHTVGDCMHKKFLHQAHDINTTGMTKFYSD